MYPNRTTIRCLMALREIDAMRDENGQPRRVQARELCQPLGVGLELARKICNILQSVGLLKGRAGPQYGGYTVVSGVMEMELIRALDALGDGIDGVDPEATTTAEQRMRELFRNSIVTGWAGMTVGGFIRLR